MSTANGKHSIPLWVLGAIMIGFCAGALALYLPFTGFLQWNETELVSITKVSFTGGAIVVTARSTGARPVTINEVWVNNQKQEAGVSFSPASASINANEDLVITIRYNWVTGNNYQVKLVSARDSVFLYNAVSP